MRTRTILIVFSLFFLTFISIGFTSQLVSDETHFTSAFSYVTTPFNLHPVIEGRVYRSSEMPEDALREKIQTLKIKTVIDLRVGGENPRKKGYSEKTLVKEMGATYLWIPMVGTHTRQKKSIERVIELSNKVEEPVLIHCDSGSHRSGVVSAIWLMNTLDTPPSEAAKQLHPSFGFYYWERKFKSIFLGTQTIDHIIWNFLTTHEKNGVDFNTWVSENSNPL